MMADITTGWLNAQDAAALDAELMSSPGFSLGELDAVHCNTSSVLGTCTHTRKFTLRTTHGISRIIGCRGSV